MKPRPEFRLCRLCEEKHMSDQLCFSVRLARHMEWEMTLDGPLREVVREEGLYDVLVCGHTKKVADGGAGAQRYREPKIGRKRHTLLVPSAKRRQCGSCGQEARGYARLRPTRPAEAEKEYDGATPRRT